MAATVTLRLYSSSTRRSWSAGAGSAYTAVIACARLGAAPATTDRHTWLDVKAEITTQSSLRAATSRSATGPMAM